MRAKRSLAIAGGTILILAGVWLALRPRDEAVGDGREVSSPENAEASVGPTIKLGPEGQANSLLYAEGSIWVAGYDRSGHDLVRIDPATNEVVARIPLDASPMWEVSGEGMAAGGGAVWVTGGANHALLQRIDPAINQVVATIRLGRGSGADVAVDDSGVWVSAFGEGAQMRLVRVDPETNRVVAPVPIPGNWVREVFALEGAIVVRTLPGSRLTVIDPATNEVVASRPIEGGVDPAGFSAWGGAVWAGKNRELLRIDPHTARIVGEPIRVGAAIGGDSLIAEENGFWFQGYEPNRPSTGSALVRFNPHTGDIDVSVDPPKTPIALALAPDSIWVLNYQGSVTRIDLR